MIIVIAVVAQMNVSLKLEDYVTPVELAQIMEGDELEAKEIIEGNLPLEWDELLKITSHLNLDINGLSFTPTEESQTDIDI